ncbi:MAG: GIY-YIG nuclease family protein [Bacteroidota bacterium]
MVMPGYYPPKADAGSSPVPATKKASYLRGFFILEYLVYILFSEKHQKTYCGMTSNLIGRFKSHNELGTKGWTVKFRPWEVICLEDLGPLD